MDHDTYKVQPVGRVHAGKDGFSIEIDKPCRASLTGLEGFSHIIILWWGNLTDSEEYRRILEAPKPYTKGPEVIGIFATRSPVRPNPIELSTVAVLSVDNERGIITLPWIDAEDGSPVLDIKPYHPSEDRVKNVAVPEWCAHWPMWQEDSETFDWESEFNF